MDLGIIACICIVLSLADFVGWGVEVEGSESCTEGPQPIHYCSCPLRLSPVMLPRPTLGLLPTHTCTTDYFHCTITRYNLTAGPINVKWTATGYIHNSDARPTIGYCGTVHSSLITSLESRLCFPCIRRFGSGSCGLFRSGGSRRTLIFACITQLLLLSAGVHPHPGPLSDPLSTAVLRRGRLSGATHSDAGVPVVASSSHPPLPSVEMGRRRGRPPGVSSSSFSSSRSTLSTLLPLPRARGRPFGSSVVTSLPPDSSQPVRRSRGRPRGGTRASPRGNPATSTPDSSQPVRRSRGRPRGGTRAFPRGNPATSTITTTAMKSADFITPVFNSSEDCKSVFKNSNDCDFNIACLNTRSSTHKGSLIVDIIRHHKLDLLFCVETWYSTNSTKAVTDDCVPPGYIAIHSFRPSRGGGISVIYRESLCVRRLSLLKRNTFESLACRVILGELKINILCIYRSTACAPSVEFFAELSNTVDEISLLTGEPLLLGDYNCPGLTPTTCDERLIAAMSDLRFTQQVVGSTHHAPNAAGFDSQLDLLFHVEGVLSNGSVAVVSAGLSDHDMISFKLNIKPVPPTKITTTFRNFNSLNIQEFIHELNNCSFITSPSSDVDCLCEQLRIGVTAALDKLCPLRFKSSPVGKRLSNFPLSIGAIDAKRVKRRLERIYVKHRSEINRINLRNQCKRANRLIRLSRIAYNQSLFSEASGDAKATWKLCNTILHRGPPRMASTLDADTFNNFFHAKISEIKQKIAENIALLPPCCSEPPPIAFDNDIDVAQFTEFSRVSTSEVYNLIMSSKPKYCVNDILPTVILRRCAETLSPTLARICNLSFASGVFPSSFKLGCITPILKKPGLDQDATTSYRPITTLPAFSKILERLALKQFQKIIVGSDRFPKSQSAYRAGHSTETALLRVTEDIRGGMGKNEATCLLSLDLSAAFDTLDHGALLARAQSMFGISGVVLTWLKSYLADRSAFTLVDGRRSAVATFKSGVPQGSILGPLLFSLYVAPIGHLSDRNGVNNHHFADDTQLYISISPTSCGLTRLTSCADSINAWFLHNGLLLNTTKTECVLFGTRAKLDTINIPAVTPFTGVTLELSKSVRIMGVTLDNQLSMGRYVGEVVSACYYHIRALKHIRAALPLHVATSIAVSLILSKLDYCNSLLYDTSDQNIARLQRVQNTAARAVLQAGRREPSAPLLHRLHWLPIKQRIVYKIAVLTFQVLNTGQPHYLAELINRKLSQRVLRSTSQSLLSVPLTRLVSCEAAFSAAAPAVWNSLSERVKSASSVEIFRRLCKTELFLSIV